MRFDLQKASMSKRISAFLFDFIMLGSLIVGVGYLLSSVLHYDSYVQALTDAYDRYETSYSVDFETSRDAYLAMTPEEQDNFDAAYEALIGDKEAMANYNMVINLSMIIISISVLAGYLVLEFAVPLWLKNGQTFGKKIFGIGVMHTSGIQITPMLLFFRTILGKYTLETMVPLLLLMMIFFNTIGLLGTIILGLLLLLQIILVIATNTNSFLHDILAKTVVVDLSSQLIFKDGAALLAYKKEMHAEEVARQSY